jgi:hypothetical protein
VPQNRIVELESVFQLSHDRLVGFDVDAQVMRFGEFVDHVNQLAPTPVFNPVDFTATGHDHAFVTLQHGWNLLALIWMDHEYDFVMTH